MVAPSGPVYQAGTLSGNPLAVAAGIAMLHYIQDHPEMYQDLEKRTAELTAVLPSTVTVNRAGSMFTIFFRSGPVRNYEEAKQANTHRFSSFFHHLLSRGIFFPPSQFEAAFLSTAHTAQDVAYTKQAIMEFFAQNAAA